MKFLQLGGGREQCRNYSPKGVLRRYFVVDDASTLGSRHLTKVCRLAAYDDGETVVNPGVSENIISNERIVRTCAVREER
jgi:hypothetical protein